MIYHPIKQGIVLFFLFAGLCFGSVGCHLVFPFPAADYEPQLCFKCSAEIYRSLLDNEVTEEWQAYVWLNPSSEDAFLLCAQKLDQYISSAMAPGFAWHSRNLSAIQIFKEEAADCPDPAGPDTFGAPMGAEIRWNYPVETQASVNIWLEDKEGVVRTASPVIANAYADFAERTGMPDGTANNTYLRGKRHVRFSDFYLELSTPFQLGQDMTVNTFYIQSIGTVIGEYEGAGIYRIYPGNAEFYFCAEGQKNGDFGRTRFCFDNGTSQTLTIYQGQPYSYFTLSLNLGSEVLGQNMNVQVSLSKPAAPEGRFKTHQPVVEILDKSMNGPLVDLTPDSVWDHDGDIDRFLWFENYEAVDEIFFGEGETIENIPLSTGNHEITLVVYDQKGAFGSQTMTLTVLPMPITITSPDGGECWESGTVNEITWETENFTNPVSIFLSQSGFSPHIWQIISLNTPNDGSFLWTVPDNASRTCAIKIGDVNPSGPSDVSNALFTIATPDLCTNALMVKSGRYFGTLACAGNDIMASCENSPQPDVWYSYTALNKGKLRVNTCGTNDLDGISMDSGMDSVLSLHEYLCLTPEIFELPDGCNNDWPVSQLPFACAGTDGGYLRDSAVSVDMEQDQTVLIRVSKVQEPFGNTDFVLNLSFEIEECAADLDRDGDVDGKDLSKFISDPEGVELIDFAALFGIDNCSSN